MNIKDKEASKISRGKKTPTPEKFPNVCFFGMLFAYSIIDSKFLFGRGLAQIIRILKIKFQNE